MVLRRRQSRAAAWVLARRAPGVYSQAGSHPGGLPPDASLLADIEKDRLPSRRPCSQQARVEAYMLLSPD